MTQGQRKVLQVKPEYGYQHPDCKMTTPPGTPAKQPLKFDLELINWYPASEVRQYGEDDNVFKRTLTESDSWETATPPYQVRCCCLEMTYTQQLSPAGGWRMACFSAAAKATANKGALLY